MSRTPGDHVISFEKALQLTTGAVKRDVEHRQPISWSTEETVGVAEWFLFLNSDRKRTPFRSDDPHDVDDTHCADCDRPELCDIIKPGTGPCGKNRGLVSNDVVQSAEGANTRQVGGSHYSTELGFQHWDLVAMFKWDYFQGQITKYLMRWRKKNGVQDLEKAQHFLEKYIELIKDGLIK